MFDNPGSLTRVALFNGAIAALFNGAIAADLELAGPVNPTWPHSVR